ncbi:MAG: hypothetical protein ACRBF0_17780 [Calditrichia bacterium]
MNTLITAKAKRTILVVLSVFLLFAGQYYFTLQGADEQPEIIEEPYYPNLDLGIEIPIDAKFTLLNKPENAGDVAELELMITSRLDDAVANVAIEFPAAISKQSGTDSWSGKLNINETKRMQLAVVVDSEAPQSVSAKVTLTKDDVSVTRGAAYHFDLGEPDHASQQETAVKGFKGGDKLNIIVPRKKQQ